jgi:hypothetical protein
MAHDGEHVRPGSSAARLDIVARPVGELVQPLIFVEQGVQKPALLLALLQLTLGGLGARIARRLIFLDGDLPDEEQGGAAQSRQEGPGQGGAARLPLPAGSRFPMATTAAARGTSHDLPQFCPAQPLPFS